MSLAIAILVALGGGLIGMAGTLGGRAGRRAGVMLALVAAAACLVLAVTTHVGDSTSFGGIRLTVTAITRLALFGWSAGLIGLGLVGAGLRSRNPAPAGLVAMAAAVGALGIDQAAVGFGLLAVGGTIAVLVPALGGSVGGSGGGGRDAVGRGDAVGGDDVLGAPVPVADGASPGSRAAAGAGSGVVSVLHADGQRAGQLTAFAGSGPRGLVAASAGTARVTAVLRGSGTSGASAAARASFAARAATATLGSGVVAMVLVAWARSPVGASASGAIVAIQDVAFQSAIGLAVLGMAAAVAVRAAAIPVHLWAARLVGAIAPLGVPSSLGWGSGVFAVIAVGWAGSTLGTAGTTLDGWSRGLIAIVAIGGLVLGALASALHDDLEHVLGYWLVGAAGFTLLAFTALGANTAADVADWALGIAGLSTGFAAWIAVTRWTFAGAHRVGALAGWARRSPLLALGLLLLLVGSIGLPGTALAAARSSIAGGLPDPLASVVAVLPAVASIVVFGRLLLAGVERPAGEVAAAARDRLGVLVAPRGGWTGGGATWRARRIVALVRANRALALGIVVVALCGLAAELAALGTAAAGG